MTRIPHSVMRERKMRVLAYLENVENIQTEPPCLSYRELGRELNLGCDQVRRVCMLLQEGGFIRIEPRFLRSGAQIENAYWVTPLGRQEVLALNAG